MNGNARGDVDYDAITSLNPNMSKLSPSEVATLKQAFETLFSADTGYIVGNMDVLPVALSGLPLNAPVGIPVATTGSASAQTGATTALQDITGKGSVQ